MLAGSQVAFGKLMRLHYADMYKYGCSLKDDDELVKDCIQNVCLNVWRTRANLRQIDQVKFYLLRSLRHEVYKELSRDKKETDNLELFSRNIDHAQITRQDVIITREEEIAISHKIADVVQMLSPRQQEIIYLRFYMAMTPEQIAEIISINRQSVYNLLSDALKRMKEKMNVMQ